MLISNMIFAMVPLRRGAPNTNEQRPRSGLCERVIRHEETETKGLVHFNLSNSQKSSYPNEYRVKQVPLISVFLKHVRSRTEGVSLLASAVVSSSR